MRFTAIKQKLCLLILQLLGYEAPKQNVVGGALKITGTLDVKKGE